MDDRFDASDDPRVATFRRLMRVTMRMKRAIGPLLNESGLTGAQVRMLVRIPEEGIPLTKLAAKVWADPGNVSGMVDRLERDGLVERRPAAHDRRVVLVHTTAAGRARVEQLLPEYEQCIQRIMAPLNEEDLTRLSKLLDRLEPEDE